MRPWASPTSVLRKWQAFGLTITYTRRTRAGHMGRFGGGWNWKVGVQVGGKTVIISLLVAELRVAPTKATR